MPGLNIKRNNMTKSVQMNYKGGPKFFKIGWKYQDCDNCNGFYIQFRQTFAKETFSYDEHLKK